MNFKRLKIHFQSAIVLASLCGGLQAQTLSVQTGLQLWLKTDAGIVTNAAGAVVEWDDQTVNKNNAIQPDETAAPALVKSAQNNQAVVRFDGDNDYLEAPDAPSLQIVADISSFFVVKFDDFATYRAVWAKTVNNVPGPNDYYLLPGTGIPRAYRGDGTTTSLAAVDGTTAVRAGNYVVLGFQQAGTTFTHYLNGQAVGSGEITIGIADGGTPLKIGTREDLFTKMKGDIGELLIYDRALTATERASVFTYLQTKFGIVNQPPTVTIATPANNATVTAPGVITLTANASDSDGVVSKVDFFVNGVLAGTATAAPYKIQLRVQTAGIITLGAVATDNKDGTATATNVVITATGTSTPTYNTSTNLQLWLKADAGVTSDAGGVVSAWKDQSGQGNDALPIDASLAPVVTSNVVNGKPALLFDGDDDYLEVAHSDSLTITGDIATFFVVRFTDYATYRAVWSKTASNLPRPTDYYLLPNSGVPRVYRGGDLNGNVNQAVDGTGVPAGAFALLGFSQEGTTMTHYFNGRASGSGQITVEPTDPGNPLKIGTREDFVTRMKGEIAEVLIFNSALNTPARDTLSTYLGAKYGIPIVSASNTLPTVTLSAPAGGTTVAGPTNLSVTATAADTDGSVVRVDFYANGGFVGSAAKSPYKIDFAVPVAGAISLTAIVRDNLGASITSAPVALTATSTQPIGLPVTSDLALWMRADAGVTANAAGLVTSWGDYSGNYNNAVQADTGASPLLVQNGLNGLPVLRFDGANDMLEAAGSPSLANVGDITSLFVVKFDDFATYRAVWTKTGGNLPRSTDFYLLPGTGVPRLIRGGPAGFQSVDGDPYPAATYVIGGFEQSGTTVTHYLDGVASAAGDISAVLVDTANTLRIGTRGDNGTRMKGDIAEIIIYNSALSDADRDKVTEYLHNKYFVQPPVQPKFTSIKTQGANIVIEWQTNATLEGSDNVTGAWVPVPAATSPFTITSPGARKFYRLRL